MQNAASCMLSRGSLFTIGDWVWGQTWAVAACLELPGMPDPELLHQGVMIHHGNAA